MENAAAMSYMEAVLWTTLLQTSQAIGSAAPWYWFLPAPSAFTIKVRQIVGQVRLLAYGVHALTVVTWSQNIQSLPCMTGTNEVLVFGGTNSVAKSVESVHSLGWWWLHHSKFLSYNMASIMDVELDGE